MKREAARPPVLFYVFSHGSEPIEENRGFEVEEVSGEYFCPMVQSREQKYPLSSFWQTVRALKGNRPAPLGQRPVRLHSIPDLGTKRSSLIRATALNFVMASVHVGNFGKHDAEVEAGRVNRRIGDETFPPLPAA